MYARTWGIKRFAWTTIVLVFTPCGLLAAPAQDGGTLYQNMAPLEQYLMADRNTEIALARSAAPSAIAADATVLVLGRRGYETAVEGKNGFVCLVDRKWQAPFFVPDFWNPKVRAPICLNPQAARSVLPTNLKRTELVLAGLSKTEMMARIRSAFEKKQLSAPEPGAMAYMMSKEQYLSDASPHFQPHLMFYVPNKVATADWGANKPQSPVMGGGDSGEPLVTFIVPVTHWSDGTPATEHPKR